jgi:phosphate transport system permease protein
MTQETQEPSAATIAASLRPAKKPRGDAVFSGFATGAGVLILVILAGVALFLIAQSWPAMTAKSTDIPDGKSLLGYSAPLIFGTLLAAVLALLIATPVSLGIALFISHYAPKRLAQGLGYLVDLLAAIPSVVYGLWGIVFLAAQLTPAFAWLADHAGWIPLFKGPASPTGRTMLTLGVVLAVMILPIMTAICREIFLQTPKLYEEAALALGATRWEMIRMAVLPYGKSGIISAAMLALGRALGETMAVALVLSVGGGISLNLISSENPSTIAANIALQFPESSGKTINVLIFTGLILFIITLVVNLIARWFIARRAEFSGAN